MPTGQPAHFKRWTESINTRERLKKILIRNIADNHANPKIRKAFSFVRSYGNVWNLVHADIRELKSIPNLGPKTRQVIKDHLVDNGIFVDWV